MRIDSPFYQPQGVLGFSQYRKRSRFVFAMWIAALLALGAAATFGVLVIIPQGPATAPAVSIDVPSDARAATTALERAGVLTYDRTFRVLIAVTRNPIHAGSYTVSPHLSVWSLVRLVTTTRPRPERVVRIIEGWNVRDIGQY
ncbi:MAG: endolytic transglycosylase MltG, partial [bacterium]|nr:endolytic transglycosylase MltG [bacterium]